jgi:hypothetical protein
VAVLVGVPVKVALAPGLGVSVIHGVKVGEALAVHASVGVASGVQVSRGAGVTWAGTRNSSRNPVQ